MEIVPKISKLPDKRNHYEIKFLIISLTEAGILTHKKATLDLTFTSNDVREINFLPPLGCQ